MTWSIEVNSDDGMSKPLALLATIGIFVVGAVVVLAAIALLGRGSGGKTMDGVSVEESITTELRTRLAGVGLDGSKLSVTCPNAPMKAGYIFDCDLSGYPSVNFRHVRVTEDDNDGHFHFEAF